MSTPRSLTLPACARPVTLDSPFGPIAALVADPSPSYAGPPRDTVLLLPGFTGSKEDFLTLIEPIAEAGHPVVAVDQRGQYESVGPEDVDTIGYSLDRFADEANAVAATLGERVHVVGHSFGGVVAQSMVVRDPERARSLTLLCTGPGALPPDQHGELDTFITGLPFVGKDAAFTIMRERAIATRGPATPEVEEFVRRRFVANSAGSLIGIASILKAAPDRTDELAALDLLVQVVFGENDDAWPIEVQRETAERLGAQVHVIPDAAHSPNVENPVETARLLVTFFSAAETD